MYVCTWNIARWGWLQFGGRNARGDRVDRIDGTRNARRVSSQCAASCRYVRLVCRVLPVLRIAQPRGALLQHIIAWSRDAFGNRVVCFISLQLKLTTIAADVTRPIPRFSAVSWSCPVANSRHTQDNRECDLWMLNTVPETLLLRGSIRTRVTKKVCNVTSRLCCYS